jgi:tripartite-type tricarboxylate transporter receptor subunit TctC
MPNSTPRRRLLGAIAVATLCGAPLSVRASDEFPNRPIRIVVPYAAGGGTDTIARLVGSKLGEAWKATVVIENKPGAGGTLGNDLVAKAPADGYTVLMGITALVQAPALFAKLPYDFSKDLQPLTVIARSADLLLVPRDVPASTVAEFVALAKAAPDKYALGTYGNGTSSHIHAAMLTSQAGLDLAFVPYKGAAPLMNDLLGGQVRAAFVDSTTAQPHLAGGKLKVLAVTGARPSPLAPNAPTFASLGYRSFEPYGWFAMFAPAGTPPAVVKKLSDEIIRIVAQPAVRERLQTLGLQAGGDPPADFAREAQADLGIWAKVIKDAHIKLD